MPGEIQHTENGSMISIAEFVKTSGEKREFHWFKIHVSDAPNSQHLAADFVEAFRDVLEDENEWNMLDSQKQAPVKFYASPTTEVQNLPVMIDALIDSARTTSQSFAPILKSLVEMTSRNEIQFLSSLTDEDYQSFIASLDILIDVVGEDENHLFAHLMDFVGKLIEKYEEITDTMDWRESLDDADIEDNSRTELCLPIQGIEAAYSDDEVEYTLDMLIEENSYYEEI